jgi:hypothetical protein
LRSTPRMFKETRSCCFREFGSGKRIVGLSLSRGRIGADRGRGGVSRGHAFGRATDGTNAPHATIPISPIGPIRSTAKRTVPTSGLGSRNAHTPKRRHASLRHLVAADIDGSVQNSRISVEVLGANDRTTKQHTFYECGRRRGQVKIVGRCINEIRIGELRIQIVLGSSDKGWEPVVRVVIPDPLRIGITNSGILKVVVSRNSRSVRGLNSVPDQ